MHVLKVLDSEEILQKLGYTYHKRITPKIEPERASIRFLDIVPELIKNPETQWIANQYLYKHQLEALRFLDQGYNIILKSGTGSGKTEAWFFYFFNKAKTEKFKAIAIYPTLALANDQIKRISNYASTANIKVLKLDALQRDEYIKRLGISGLRKLIAESDLVITNPAFLHHEIKKLILNPSKSLLYPLFRDLNLLVIDELDFYGPRSIALLLALIDIIAKFSSKDLQVAILTATLANPEDMCRYLEDITKRKCAIISGLPFAVENRSYIVLGKNLRDIWIKLQQYLHRIAKYRDVDKDVIEALKDFEQFKNNAYRVVSYLEALGFEVPSLGLNPIEILASYANDDGVTLVFTRSIARAEEIAKALKSIVGDKVASHHHLVPKKLREEIEERARLGDLKIIVSPRTLTQGIDIGTVIRVVHIGLPEDVREFFQREGRKGRRQEIPFTESIIIPSTRWDWELLSKGFKALEKWLSLPLEKIIINPDNDYIKLFKVLAKILSPWLEKKFTEDEYRLLRIIRILRRDGTIDYHRAKWIWERLNFYEFGPPYGIKRYLEVDNELKPLEPIGHCDLVERFQIGCIDLSQDAIVVKLNKGKSTRIVTSVIEKPLSRFNFYENDAIAEAIEEYRYIKTLWGEEPSLLKDIARGKMYSYVLAVVYPPKQGFGELRKIPNRVIWFVSSSKPHIVRLGDRHIVTYNRKTIYVPVNTFGEYRDFTYGIIIETDDREDPVLLRLGLAYLMIMLRRLYGIAFETIMYGVERIGEKKFFELHEPESCGLLKKLDWLKIRKDIEQYQPDDLDLVLLSQIDDIAYSDLVALGLDLSALKEIALRIIDYILLRDKLTAYFHGKRISIPKPSRALKLLALEAISHMISEETVVPKAIVGIAFYDGEKLTSTVDLYIKYPFNPPPLSLRELENTIEDLIYYEEFKPIVFDKDKLIKELEQMHMKKLINVIREHAISLVEILERIGFKQVSLSQFIESLELDNIDKPRLVDLVYLHRKIQDFIETSGEKATSLPSNLTIEIKRFLENRAKSIYIAFIVARSLIES